MGWFKMELLKMEICPNILSSLPVQLIDSDAYSTLSGQTRLKMSCYVGLLHENSSWTR